MPLVLQISEIQDRIFSFNGRGDAARCAIVCKAWNDVALDHVWYELTDVWPLFNLLAPLKPARTAQGMCSYFTRKIRPSDWARYFPIAERVKWLTILPTSNPNHYFPGESAFTEVLRSRTELRILPKLKVLQIFAFSDLNRLRYATLFLREDLETFIFSADGYSTSETETFLEEVASRAPKLQTFELYVRPGTGEIMNDALARSIASQTSLERLSLSPGMLTTQSLNLLSRLPKLERLETALSRIPDERHYVSSIETMPCGLADTQTSFPSILCFSVQTRLASVTKIISSHSNFVRLQKLCVDMVCHNDADDVRKCLEVVSTVCTSLVHLKLTRIQDIGNRAAVLEQERNVIDKDTLAPLTSFTCLREFTLRHTQPILMSDDDFIDLITRCHPLTQLYLNPSPKQLVPPSLHLPTLGVMHRIAKCQPGLKRLSLCLDARSGDLPCSADVLSNPFFNLETLFLGNSVVGDVDRIALYLAQILPPGCVADANSAIDTPVTPGWKEVSNKLPLLIKFCSEQRQRSRELENMVRTCHSIHNKPVLDAMGGNASRNVWDQEQCLVEMEMDDTAEAMSI